MPTKLAEQTVVDWKHQALFVLSPGCTAQASADSANSHPNGCLYLTRSLLYYSLKWQGVTWSNYPLNHQESAVRSSKLHTFLSLDPKWLTSAFWTSFEFTLGDVRKCRPEKLWPRVHARVCFKTDLMIWYHWKSNSHTTPSLIYMIRRSQWFLGR